jgi:hypothetical protein
LSIVILIVSVAGVNGNMPNMDLWTLLYRICKKRHYALSFDSNIPTYQEDFASSSKNLGRFLLTQSFVPFAPGCHGPLMHYRIDALTISVSHFNRTGKEKAKFQQDSEDEGDVAVEDVYSHLEWRKFLNIIETLMRSCSTAVEHLFQSFYFYLLPSTHYFIPLSLYAPTVLAWLAALLIFAMHLWMLQDKSDESNLQASTKEEKNEPKKSDQEKTNSSDKDEHKSSAKDGSFLNNNEKKPFDTAIDLDKIYSVLLPLAVVFISKFCSFVLLYFLSKLSMRSLLVSFISTTVGFYSVIILFISLPNLIIRILAHYLTSTAFIKGKTFNFYRVKVVLILIFGGEMLLLFIMNYSLSCIATVLLSEALFFCPAQTDNKTSYQKYRRNLLFINPCTKLLLLHVVGAVNGQKYLSEVLDAHLIGKWLLWVVLASYWSALISLRFITDILEKQSNYLKDEKMKTD